MLEKKLKKRIIFLFDLEIFLHRFEQILFFQKQKNILKIQMQKFILLQIIQIKNEKQVDLL